MSMVLVRMKRPISSLDFCYSGETETISVQVKILIFLQHVIIVLAFLCMYWTCRGWWQYKKVCFCSREKVFFVAIIILNSCRSASPSAPWLLRTTLGQRERTRCSPFSTLFSLSSSSRLFRIRKQRFQQRWQHVLNIKIWPSDQIIQQSIKG